MALLNTNNSYGFFSRFNHWISALVIVSMYALGWWMVDLDYYNVWYQRAPFIHKSTGILFTIFLSYRLIWRFMNTNVNAIETQSTWEKELARVTHVLLYVLMIVLVLSGYLISTAKGDPINVFNWFEVPALFNIRSGFNLEDIAGDVHEIVANSLVIISGIHALAALKHHFIDKDNTLKRMTGSKR